MIYANEARALKVADELNRRRGYLLVGVFLTEHGWTVQIVPA